MKNNTINIFILSLLLASFSFVQLQGQETAYYNNSFENYILGKSYFEQELYGQASESLKLFLEENRFLPDSESNAIYNLDAQSLHHISALRLQLPEAESNLASFIAEHHPNPLITDAIFEMGDYYYNEKQYANCIEYFELIDIDGIPEIKMSELAFKKGYCHFVRKEFNGSTIQFQLYQGFAK